ncbi:hypothetical protein [Ferruginibacter sp.]
MNYYSRIYKLSTLIFILLFCGGCLQNNQKGSSDNNQSITLATQIIKNYTTQEYNDLKNKLFDPSLSERAKIWYPAAEMIRSLTANTYLIVDSCFKFCTENNFDESKSRLLDILGKYKASVLEVNPEIWKSFRDEFSTLLGSATLKTFISSKANKELQDRIDNSISIIENRTISFCNLKTSPGCILRLENFSVLMGQNSKHFKSGEKIEITAGVGSFSTASQPKINIDNEFVSLNNLGYVEFKKVVKGYIGRHIIPVTITYTSPDGILKTTKQEIEYFIDQ